MSDELFGPYRLEELLGRGGMGEVYRAFHTEQERVVALKLLLPALSNDDVFRRRFLRESRLAARLTDPHVIPVHGWGEVDGRLYLDMRFVEGEDLSELLGRCGALPPARAVDIVEQVASALDAAHGMDLVHRDVKPSNVLLAASGGADGFAYLADFGIARLTQSEDTSGITSGGAAIGTLAYMAPERFLGDTLDKSADVYSLACVLYECLTGRRPFEVTEPIAIISAHLYAEPPLPSQLDPRVPPALDDVVAVGLAKEPSQRYASAGALAAAARAALSTRTPTSVPPSRRTSAPRTPAPRTPPPQTPHPLLPAPPAMAAQRYDQPDPARPHPAPPRHEAAPWSPAPAPAPAPAPPSRRRVGRLLPVLAVLVLIGVAAGVLLLIPAARGPVSPSPSTAATPGPTAAPTLSEVDRALLTALPPGFRAEDCAASQDLPAGATAALRCVVGPEGVAGSAEFVRFSDVATLDRYMAADAARRNLPLDTGNCRDGANVQTTWSKNGQVAGLLVCYAGPDRARTLQWTDRRALAMGVVTRADGNSAALYDWWTRYDFAA